MSRTSSVLSVLILLFASTSAVELNCLDNAGQPVPWWFVYKYPGNVSSSSPRHGYVDPITEGFQTQNGYVDDKGQAMTNTIDLMNSAWSDSMSILVFNDEPSNVSWVSWGAHAKGILAYDSSSNTGVYILHSAPKFPDVFPNGTINTTLPSNTHVYGQHFFCMTFDHTALDAIVANLQIIYPIIYAQAGIFTKIDFESGTAMQAVNSFNLIDGENAFILSKSPNYTEGFLYENIIQPYFQVDLYVESWGRPYQAPICPGKSTYETLNVDNVQFANGDGWDHYSDHSKWAVAPGSEGVVCGCDMNRMDSQALRGGSCVCMENPVLYGALTSVVKKVDKC